MLHIHIESPKVLNICDNHHGRVWPFADSHVDVCITMYRIHQGINSYLANRFWVVYNCISKRREELAVEIRKLGVLEDALEFVISFTC